MHLSPVVVLSAVTLVAALGLSGCADESAPPASSRQTTPVAVGVGPEHAPLPAPEALADVISRLADISIPAEQKVGLVQYATADDEAVLENFGEALKASGFVPVTVQATDVAWAPTPGNVTASVTIATTDANVHPFTYPMEFDPLRDAWQLTRKSAEQFLPLVDGPRPTPTG